MPASIPATALSQPNIGSRRTPWAINARAGTKAGLATRDPRDPVFARSGALRVESNTVVAGHGPPPDAWVRNVAEDVAQERQAQRRKRSLV
jgi:hypothetical protein